MRIYHFHCVRSMYFGGLTINTVFIRYKDITRDTVTYILLSVVICILVYVVTGFVYCMSMLLVFR